MGLRDRIQGAGDAARLGCLMVLEGLQSGIVFNPTAKALRSDPFPFYRKLRERDPFHRTYPGDGWVLTRYDDVSAVLSDRTFSADERHQRRWERIRRRGERLGIPDPYEEGRASMLRIDAPDHTRLRGLVSKAFTPRAIDAMRPRIASLLDEVFEGIPRSGRFDLISRFASPFPVSVIAEMLGVAVEDRDRFRAWSDSVIMTLGDSTEVELLRAQTAMEELGEYLTGVCDERRREPRDDMLTSLVQAEEAGDKLSEVELLTTCVLLLVAGNETTTKLLANSMLALLRNPEQLEILAAEPKRIPGAVDEFLRYDGPVQLTSRMVCEDREFRGHRLRKGQQVILMLAAANRDPEQFDRPDELDVTRDGVRHLALSAGSHFCLGAQLARLEAGLALEALITRLPGLRLCDEEIRWGSNTILRGPEALWLEVGA